MAEHTSTHTQGRSFDEIAAVVQRIQDFYAEEEGEGQVSIAAYNSVRADFEFHERNIDRQLTLPGPFSVCPSGLVWDSSRRRARL